VRKREGEYERVIEKERESMRGTESEIIVEKEREIA
jgi:hypothetical protein